MFADLAMLKINSSLEFKQRNLYRNKVFVIEVIFFLILEMFMPKVTVRRNNYDTES